MKFSYLLAFLGLASSITSLTIPHKKPSELAPRNVIAPRNIDSECHGPGRGFVHFSTSSAPGITFYIHTPWWLRYTHSLKNKLSDAGFESVQLNGARCGWKYFDAITKTDVDRGNIGYRYIDEDELRENGKAQASGPPTERTFGEICEVMETTYPTLEITLICVFALSPIWGFLLLSCCGCCCGDLETETGDDLPPKDSF